MKGPLPINCTLKVTIPSETRHLFEYYMLSDYDVSIIQDLYFNLVSSDEQGIKSGNFLAFYGFPEKSFYNNIVEFITLSNGLINFYSFVKFILILSMEDIPTVMINIYEFFLSDEGDNDSAVWAFLSLYPSNVVSDSDKIQFEFTMKLYDYNYIKFFRTKYTDKDYYNFFIVFSSLLSSIKAKSIPPHLLKAIKYRCDNHYDLYQYHISHNDKYPRLSLCQLISMKINNFPNPNIFNYYMSNDCRSRYKFPLLFQISGLIIRGSFSQCSGLSGSFLVPSRMSKRSTIDQPNDCKRGSAHYYLTSNRSSLLAPDSILKSRAINDDGQSVKGSLLRVSIKPNIKVNFNFASTNNLMKVNNTAESSPHAQPPGIIINKNSCRSQIIQTIPTGYQLRKSINYGNSNLHASDTNNSNHINNNNNINHNSNNINNNNNISFNNNLNHLLTQNSYHIGKANNRKHSSNCQRALSGNYDTFKKKKLNILLYNGNNHHNRKNSCAKAINSISPSELF